MSQLPAHKEAKRMSKNKFKAKLYLLLYYLGLKGFAVDRLTRLYWRGMGRRIKAARVLR